MSFNGSVFLYNNRSSEEFDLRILNFSVSSPESVNAGSEPTLLTKWIYRKENPYVYGRTYNTPLEFDLEIGSLDPIPGYQRSQIENWLLGASTYLPFQVIQNDIAENIFYSVFTKVSNLYIGNLNVGMKLHMTCNAPWSYTSSKTDTYTYAGNANQNITFYNSSDNNDYLYPVVTFVTSGLDPNFTITNYSDLNPNYPLQLRPFGFTSLPAGITVTVDNYKQTISSDNGDLLISKFNKNFFRYIPGINNIAIQGGINSVTFTYSFARKIGA